MIAIVPTIGRKLYYYPLGDPGTTKIADDQPIDSTVIFVYPRADENLPFRLNLFTIDHIGNIQTRQSVLLVQDGEPVPNHCDYAKWMPYQVGQATKQSDPVAVPQTTLTAVGTTGEQVIEAEIQAKGLTAPRLTPSDIDAAIVGESFTVLPSGKVMVCELTLRNGFTVRGESATVSKENFNAEIGQKISRENARNKVWELEGYLLQQKLFEAK